MGIGLGAHLTGGEAGAYFDLQIEKEKQGIKDPLHPQYRPGHADQIRRALMAASGNIMAAPQGAQNA
jgi:hypothetical protein